MVKSSDGVAETLTEALEWTCDADPADSQYLADFADMLREPDGSPPTIADRPVFGLFARADWLRLISRAGFEVRRMVDDCGRDVFVGSRSRP